MRGPHFLLGAGAIVCLALALLGFLLTATLAAESRSCGPDHPDPAICERTGAAARSSLLVSTAVASAGLVLLGATLILRHRASRDHDAPAGLNALGPSHESERAP